MHVLMNCRCAVENRFLFGSAGNDVNAVQVDDLLLGGRGGGFLLGSACMG